jgi:hypothetical protein
LNRSRRTFRETPPGRHSNRSPVPGDAGVRQRLRANDDNAVHPPLVTVRANGHVVSAAPPGKGCWPGWPITAVVVSSWKGVAMSMSLLMGWALLAGLLALVVALFILVLISGRSAKRAGRGLSPEKETPQVTPVNVFHHVLTSPAPAPAPARAPATGQWSASAPGEWAAPAPGQWSASGPGEWAAPARGQWSASEPGEWAAPAPGQWSSPAGLPAPAPGQSAAPRMGGAAALRRWYPGMGAARAPLDEG